MARQGSRANQTNRGSAKTSRRGRAPGADLSDEQKHLIISSIEAGGTRESAARAAGISARTYRELRQRARGRHPERPPLPHLKRFFEDVEQAIGRRLLANEIWLSKNDPKFALKYLRSSLDADVDDEESPRLPTAEELQAEIDVLILSGAFRAPRCQEDSACRNHSPKGDSP